jgi:hypothetical protein
MSCGNPIRLQTALYSLLGVIIYCVETNITSTAVNFAHVLQVCSCLVKLTVIISINNIDRLIAKWKKSESSVS